MSITDEIAVTRQIARIAQLADDGDLADYVDCFSSDARWDMPGAPRRGRAEILAGGQERRAAGTGGPGSHSRHVISTIAVTVDGDTANATSYWQFYVTTSTTPTLQALGKYDDVFVRAVTGWKLDHRAITIG